MQQYKQRMFGLVGLLVVLAMLLAACPAPVPAAAPAGETANTEAAASTDGPVTLTVATVNNPDMQVMQTLTGEFETAYPNIKLEWVVLPENELRARVTTDVATGAASFDVVTVGTYEVPIWGGNDWIFSVDQLAKDNPDNVQADYDFDDLLPAIRKGLSKDDQLFALLFAAWHSGRLRDGFLCHQTDRQFYALGDVHAHDAARWRNPAALCYLSKARFA